MTNLPNALLQLADDQFEEVFGLFRENTEYWRRMNEVIDRASVRRMLAALPPGAAPSAKTNKVLVLAGRIAGLIEVVEHYPDADTAMIGLLIVRRDSHRCGVGTHILEATLSDLERKEIRSVFLSYPRSSEQSRKFWESQFFEATGDVDEYEDVALVCMERSLVNR